MLQLLPVWNTTICIVRLFQRCFHFQDNTGAIVLVDQGTSQLDRPLNEDWLPNAHTTEVVVLEGALNSHTVVETEKEVTDKFLHENHFENVDHALIKNEMGKNTSQEHELHQNGMDINVKCEVKDEIKIEEHEVYVEDIQDVR
jgi:hypothetical protein